MLDLSSVDSFLAFWAVGRADKETFPLRGPGRFSGGFGAWEEVDASAFIVGAV